jgi:ArsR family transcriptional regulator, arsenate/arsenite/antimonite-responsive transcriptional repressor
MKKKLTEQDVVQNLAALAQIGRLRAFRALVVAGPEGVTPGQISEQLAIPAATLSFHLKELLIAGLVSQERIGRNLVYRAAFAQMESLLEFLLANCCQGKSCATGSQVSKPSLKEKK